MFYSKWISHIIIGLSLKFLNLGLVAGKARCHTYCSLGAPLYRPAGATWLDAGRRQFFSDLFRLLPASFPSPSSTLLFQSLVHAGGRSKTIVRVTSPVHDATSRCIV